MTETEHPETVVTETAAEAPAAPEAGPTVETLQAEVADLKDRLLRAFAETENLRRRTEREREDTAKYAVTKLARDLTGVADNLRRAIEAVPGDARAEGGALAGLLDGIGMTERELLAAFEKAGITRIAPALGEKADPNKHEVLFEAPGTGQPGGAIIQVIQTGYQIHDRLLRAAKVGVAKAESVAPVVDQTA
ncbi:nucleotide exchange factor GrpE [Zavarzinia compransoris]|uniref:Protein GrpE n=1 Tax=Zavarzinia compransoris TaxID=1264899 RepID=A0A317E6J8_9PROT|nr:nucleotide exchange factor GrpE [Zavarzinia compransoris]PWR20675.1 nucleotide exchange factor GrpE [Zavarzinia compransoris]TDP44503.1 molecular chaperone GrpE [Zavarzinia compransoris]